MRQDFSFHSLDTSITSSYCSLVNSICVFMTRTCHDRGNHDTKSRLSIPPIGNIHWQLNKQLASLGTGRPIGKSYWSLLENQNSAIVGNQLVWGVNIFLYRSTDDQWKGQTKGQPTSPVSLSLENACMTWEYGLKCPTIGIKRGKISKQL